MKNLRNISICLCLLAPTMGLSQAPSVAIVVQENTIPAATQGLLDAALPGTFPVRSFDLYLQFSDPHWEVQAIYSDNIHIWDLSVSTAFYQNVNGGLTVSAVSSALCSFMPEVCYDSYFALGAGAGIQTIPSAAPHFLAFEAGNGFSASGWPGSAVYTAQVPPVSSAITDALGNVFIARLTTDGVFCGKFNFLVRKLNADNTIYDPPGTATSESYLLNDIVLSPFPLDGDTGNGTLPCLVFLPIDDMSIEVTCDAQQRTLTWCDYSEAASDVYEVWYGADTLSMRPYADNNGSYSVVSSLGNNYTCYQLPITDITPDARYFQIRSYSGNTEKRSDFAASDPTCADGTMAFPNPIRTNESLHVVSGKTVKVLRIIDNLGIEILYKDVQHQNRMTLELSSTLRSGCYQLVLIYDSGESKAIGLVVME